MNCNIKKILSIFSKVLSWFIIVIAIFLLALTILSLTTGNDNRSILGYKFYIVLSDSMSKSDENLDIDVYINAGDIVCVKEVQDINTLKEGDIITFISTSSGSYGETITHMIKDVIKDSNGVITGFTTYGTNTGSLDDKPALPQNIQGLYSFKIPLIGYIFAFLKGKVGFLLLLIPMGVVLCLSFSNFFKVLKQYKEEKQLEPDPIKQLDEEKQKMKEVEAEIEALKKEIEKINSKNN